MYRNASDNAGGQSSPWMTQISPRWSARTDTVSVIVREPRFAAKIP